MTDQLPAEREANLPIASDFKSLGRVRRSRMEQDKACRLTIQMMATKAMGLVECARTLKVPATSLHQWLTTGAHNAAYTRAKEASADVMVEENRKVAGQAVRGEVDPRAADVFIKSNQWIAARRNRRAYGDQPMQDDSTTAADMPLDQLAAQIQALESKTGLMARLGVQITETRTVTVVAESKD